MTEEPIRSVLYGVQEAAGAQFMEDSGWVWTTTFGDAEAEYTAVRENAGMWDVYGLQKWDVSGPDAAAAVQRTFTGDVARLTVGQVKYGPFVAEDGLMADDGTVYKHADDHFWVFTNSTTFADFLAASTEGLDYTIENRTFSHAGDLGAGAALARDPAGPDRRGPVVAALLPLPARAAHGRRRHGVGPAHRVLRRARLRADRRPRATRSSSGRRSSAPACSRSGWTPSSCCGSRPA